MSKSTHFTTDNPEKTSRDPKSAAQPNTANSSKIPQPLILALETSGRKGSVALASGTKLLESRNFSAPLSHNAEMIPTAKSLLQNFAKTPADINHVYLSIGPGSFTGLRIAVAMAKALHLANNAVKIVPVSTLSVIAANVIESQTPPEPAINKIAAILDAKRGQFYIAVFQKTDTRWEKILHDSLMTAQQFIDSFAASHVPLWLLGEGLVYYADKFNAGSLKILEQNLWYPSAKNVHTIGCKLAMQNLYAEPTTLTPAYMRLPDAKIKKSH